MRVSAEFGKEALTDQSLDGDEVLAIKWANEDPNPIARAKELEIQQIKAAQKLVQKRVEREEKYEYTSGNTSGYLDQFPSTENPYLYPNTDDQYQYQQYQQYQQYYDQLQQEKEQILNSVPQSTQVDYGQNSDFIENWLKQNSLPASYADLLISGGYSDTETLTNLDEIGLDAIGITLPGHRKLLLDATQSLGKLSDGEEKRLVSYGSDDESTKKRQKKE